MKFFDERGNSIDCSHWLKAYEPQYFLGGGATKIKNRFRSSRLVEDQVCSLLAKGSLLSEDDLKLLMAWKIGAIDHRASEQNKKIAYYYGWDGKTKNRYGHPLGSSIACLASKMSDIAKEIAAGKPEYLFNLHSNLDGFGPVYIITMLFFVSQGRYPIYDRFAHIAVQAVQEGLAPGSYVSYKPVQRWSDYEEYVRLLSPIGEACCDQPKNSRMLISRPVDRALWVYGHSFSSQQPMRGAAEPAPPPVSKPQTSPATELVSSDEVLTGLIRDLGQSAANGWRRKEILIKQTMSGYPEVRQRINLLDSSGAALGELPFIKGARKAGYTCLGKPGALMAWFAQRYPFDRVRTETVYVARTERRDEYRIYSQLEWQQRFAAGSD